MSWKVKCPHCGEPYNINEEHFGKRYRCMICEQPFTMPTAEELRQANIIRCPVCLAAVAPTADNCPKCGGKMPVKIGCLKNLFCISVMIFGAFWMLLGMGLVFYPMYGEYDHPYRSYDRDDSRSPVTLGFVFTGIGAVLFFGAGAVRRRR